MSRAEFLDGLGTAPHFDPCRCGSCPDGYTFDRARNMWVHANCGKPSGAHRGYSPFCYECGQPFTYPVAIEEKYPWCPGCE